MSHAPSDRTAAAEKAENPTLLSAPHDKARALLSTGAPAFLLVNPVEYHGPHLPLHNDRIVSEGLSRDLHRRLAAQHPEWPFLIGGDLEVGVEPTRGPGTRATPFPVVRSLVRESCRALAELGAQRVVLMTFHGAPLHNIALEAGVELLESMGVRALSPLNLVLRELLEVDGTRYAEAFEGIEDVREREEMMKDLRLDFHAGFFETSMTLHYAKDAVSPSYKSLPPCPPIRPIAGWKRAADLAGVAGAAQLRRELELAASAMAWQALDPFPGYTGRPHRASPEAGAVFSRFILDRYETTANEVFAGRARSPAPIMAWSARLTMNGRFSPVHTARGALS